jgi:hypothetical protein
MRETEIKINPPGSIPFKFTGDRENREILYFFAGQDFKVKYRDSREKILLQT